MDGKIIDIFVDKIRYHIAVKHRTASRDLVVFIHGLGCSQDSFEDVWSHEDFAGISILTFDLLGFGKSDQPPYFSYSMEDHARVCEAVIHEFSSSRIHLVAHSMGGAIGLMLSDQTLDSIVSFANLEGNLVSRDCNIISKKSIGVPYGDFCKGLFLQLKAHAAGKQTRGFTMETASPLAFYKSSESLVAWSDGGHLLQRFQSLNCRKAYFYGDRNSHMDVLTSLGEIEKIAISKSGHFLMNDNPAEFYTKLRNFLPA